MRTLLVSHSRHDQVLGEMLRVLSELPEFSEPTVATWEATESPSFQTSSDLCVFFLSRNPTRGLEILRRLRPRVPGPLLVVGGLDDPKQILRVLQEGADLFLDEAELVSEFEAALRRLQHKPEPNVRTGDLFGVVSASGGSGVSTVAVNLAVVLAQAHKKSMLIDLKTGRGDLPSLLDLNPQFSLPDVCLNEARMDQAMFEKMLVRHHTGVHLLGSSNDLSRIRTVTAHGVQHALTLARKMFPATVVDLEDCHHLEQIAVLEQASTVLVVCRLDFNSVRNTRNLLEHLSGLRIVKDRIRIVVNMHGMPNELPVEEAECALASKVAVFIPHDPTTVNAANNTGVPLVLKAPGSKVAQRIAQLVPGEKPVPSGSSGLIRNIRHLIRDVFPSAR
jgi:pilus assembly protein CpaE